MTNLLILISLVILTPCFSETISVGPAKFHVDIMDTEEKIHKGLSLYPNLDLHSGIIFFYHEKCRPNFWMKGVTYPIDIIWIRQNRVVQITSNIPTANKNQKDQKLPRYRSRKSIDTVLEIHAGQATARGIQIGDRVVYDFPTNFKKRR